MKFRRVSRRSKWYDKAIELWQNGKFVDRNKAIEYLNEALHLEPDYADAYNDRGAAHDGLGQHEAAIADYNNALRLKPDFLMAYYNRANDYSYLDQRKKAITDWNKAIRLKPDDGLAYYNRGIDYHRLGRYQRAIADYNEAIGSGPMMPTPTTTGGRHTYA